MVTVTPSRSRFNCEAVVRSRSVISKVVRDWEMLVVIEAKTVTTAAMMIRLNTVATSTSMSVKAGGRQKTKGRKAEGGRRTADGFSRRACPALEGYRHPGHERRAAS